jgi:DNA-binding MarR family transcriptional regulator
MSPKPAPPRILRVAEEIQQTRPFRSAAQEALLAVMLTGDRVQTLLAARLAQVDDITVQQYNVLRILRGAGPDGIPTLAIADRMIERTPGVTRLLDRLERKGWIERERLAGDRRQVICRASKAGLKLLAKLDAVVDDVDDQPKRALTTGELEQLVELLDRLRATFT